MRWTYRKEDQIWPLFFINSLKIICLIVGIMSICFHISSLSLIAIFNPFQFILLKLSSNCLIPSFVGDIIKWVENGVDFKITHIYFENNWLLFVSETTKGYKGGEKHVGPWHFYENPFKPRLFPVLEIKLYKPLGRRPNRTQQQGG